MIIMASAGYCGYCKKAKQELEEEIQNGTVKVIDSNDTAELKKYFKKDLRGFPAFYNTENEKESIGYSLKKDLFKKLNYDEIKELKNEIKEINKLEKEIKEEIKEGFVFINSNTFKLEGCTPSNIPSRYEGVW